MQEMRSGLHGGEGDQGVMRLIPVVIFLFLLFLSVQHGHCEIRTNPSSTVCTTIFIGTPNYTSTLIFVTDSTDFSLKAEPASDVNSTWFKIDGGGWNMYKSPFNVPQEGSHRIYYNSTDKFGVNETTKQLDVHVDITPPLTSIIPSGAFYVHNGTNYTSPSTQFMFSSVDSGCGVNYTLYRIDGQQYTEYSVPFNIVAEGNHTLQYYSVDFLGNTETTLALNIFVDGRAPRTEIEVGTPLYASDKTYITPETPISLLCRDSGAGTNSIWFRIDSRDWQRYSGGPITIKGEGSHTLYFNATDNVKNLEGMGIAEFFVDSTPPVTTFASSKPSEKYTESTLFILYSSDGNGSGVQCVRYKLDGGNWTWYRGPFSLPSGKHTITYMAVDNIGNWEVAKEIVVEVGKNGVLTHAIIISSIAIFFVTVFIILGTEFGKYGFFLLLIPLYTKLFKENVLDNYLRGKVHGYIIANPGDHYNSIRFTLNLKNGALAYHLKVLEKEGLIVSMRDGIYKRFYPAGVRISKDDGKRITKIQRDITEMIRIKPGVTQKELAEFMRVSNQVVNYHIKILESSRIVTLNRVKKETHCFLIEKKEEDVPRS